jgi:hypothetical protein
MPVSWIGGSWLEGLEEALELSDAIGSRLKVPQ